MLTPCDNERVCNSITAVDPHKPRAPHMSKFSRCAHTVMSDTPSYAWIALHRCIEANARLTGERFSNIFARVGAEYGFGRQPAAWPDAARMRLAVAQLQRERDAYLKELNARIAARRAEKQAGQRHNRDQRLTEMLNLKGAHIVPQVGCWGWRLRREAERLKHAAKK